MKLEYTLINGSSQSSGNYQKESFTGQIDNTPLQTIISTNKTLQELNNMMNQLEPNEETARFLNNGLQSLVIPFIFQNGALLIGRKALEKNFRFFIEDTSSLDLELQIVEEDGTVTNQIINREDDDQTSDNEIYCKDGQIHYVRGTFSY